MKKNARITADDGEVRVDVTVRILSRNGLLRGEVQKIAVGTARKVADGLRDVVFTGFGPENTKIRL